MLAEGVTPPRSSTASSARISPDGPKTLNGLILEHLEDIPEPGTTVKIAEHPIEIVQTQDRAVVCADLPLTSHQLINLLLIYSQTPQALF